MSVSQPSATFNALLDARERAAPRTWTAYTAAAIAKLRRLAPYVAIELVMPGGSLMALGLWLYRRQRKVSLLPRTSRPERRRFGKPLTNVGSSKA